MIKSVEFVIRSSKFIKLKVRILKKERKDSNFVV